MKRHIRKAFTLLELLVVIAIIALLVALLAPNLRGMRRVANTVLCTNNLKRIGEAAGQLEIRARADPIQQLNAMRWQSQLEPFLPDQKLFICPEDDPDEGSARIPLDETASIHAWGGYSGEYTQYLRAGPWFKKLSGTQYQQINLQDGKLYDAPPYMSDDHPEVFWFIMEDWHSTSSDYDYDLSIRVTDNADGTATLLFKQHGTGYSYELIDLVKNEAVMTKAQMNGNPPGAEYTVTIGGEGLTSYGINSAVASIRHSGGKIMVIEYPWFIARSTHDWNNYESDVPGIPIFARHSGKINVLFVDGSVKLMRPDDINPADPDTEAAYWDH